MQDNEPLEPVAAIVSSQSEPSEAKKEEVAPIKASTIKPSRNSSKDAEVNNKTADARFFIVLWEIVSLLSESRGNSNAISSCSFNSNATTGRIEDKENIPPACTPKPPMQFSLGGKSVDPKKQQTARKIASLLKNPPSALRPKNQSQLSQAKGSHQKSVKR